MIHIKLQHSSIVATLVDKGSAWSLEDGLLTGAWRASDMLRSLGSIMVLGKKLCEGDLYEDLKEHVCQGLDFSVDPGQQEANVCNAVTFGVAFNAGAAKFGPVIKQDDSAAECVADECVE